MVEIMQADAPLADQKQRYALRQCFLLAIRMARREQKADNTRSSEWNHIIRFCKDADDENGTICGGGSVLRQSSADPLPAAVVPQDLLAQAKAALAFLRTVDWNTDASEEATCDVCDALEAAAPDRKDQP